MEVDAVRHPGLAAVCDGAHATRAAAVMAGAIVEAVLCAVRRRAQGSATEDARGAACGIADAAARCVKARAAETRRRALLGRIGANAVATRAVAGCACERAEVTAAVVSALARLRDDDGGRAGEDRGLAMGCTRRCAGDAGAVACRVRR